jgi:transcriptional regulator with XRE-family HTH domain
LSIFINQNQILMKNLSIGEQIKFLRTRKGWLQEDLAKRVGVTKQSISKWEKGAVEPKGKHMIELREIFQTDFGQSQTEEPELSDMTKELKKLQAQIARLSTDPASTSEHYRDLVLANDSYRRLAKTLKLEADNYDLPIPIKVLIDELSEV